MGVRADWKDWGDEGSGDGGGLAGVDVEVRLWLGLVPAVSTELCDDPLDDNDPGTAFGVGTVNPRVVVKSLVVVVLGFEDGVGSCGKRGLYSGSVEDRVSGG